MESPPDGIADRVRGILLGLCAGDRNGGPTRMALELAEYLLACGRSFRCEELLQRYVAWFLREGFDTGRVAERVFTRIGRGVAPEEAVLRTHWELQTRTAGCNPAHRAVPLAMSAHLPDEELAELACREARLTHWDPLAGRVSAAVVVLCRALVRGKAWEDCLALADSYCETRSGEAREAGSAPSISRGGFAPDVLKAAVFFVDTSPDPETALSRSLDFAGPANYCPVLVGAISGARWGASRIPAASPKQSAIWYRVQAAAESLAATWRQCAEASG